MPTSSEPSPTSNGSTSFIVGIVITVVVVVALTVLVIVIVTIILKKHGKKMNSFNVVHEGLAISNQVYGSKGQFYSQD